MFHVFLLIGRDGASVHVAADPEAAWRYMNLSTPCDLAVLTGPLPASHAAWAAAALAGVAGMRKGLGRPRQPGRGWAWLRGLAVARPRAARRRFVGRCFRRVRAALRGFGAPSGGVGGPGSARLEAPVYLPAAAAAEGAATDGATGELRPELIHATFTEMEGRVLLDEQAQKAVSAAGNYSVRQSEAVLSAACAVGMARFQPAVGIDALGRYVCNRCGARSGIVATACSRCAHAECHMCTECRAMGVSRECLGLYTVAGTRMANSSGGKAQQVAPEYDYDLTAAQRDALAACRGWFDAPAQGAGGELLVWAVCGAGKTEVAFGALAAALSRGVTAAFAVPRRDVAAEIFQRLTAAFPGMTAAAFYGGSESRSYDAPITVLTCHQAMRFAGRFGLVVLDEADAFPYCGSEALAFSLRRAMASDGRLITMTATPSAAQVARVRAGALPAVRISARHHGRPLPVPVIDATRSDGSMERRVMRLVARSIDSGWPVFVFTHSKAACVSLHEAIKAGLQLQGVSVDWMHSGKPGRDDVRRAFAEGSTKVLVCTSVMERGVTIHGADVVVANADSARVFDHRALVQMAGRAGRTAARPGGDVTFVCAAPTRAMRLAVSMIEEMNDHAVRMGYASVDK